MTWATSSAVWSRPSGTAVAARAEYVAHRELSKLIPAVDLDHLLDEIFDEVAP